MRIQCDKMRGRHGWGSWLGSLGRCTSSMYLSRRPGFLYLHWLSQCRIERAKELSGDPAFNETFGKIKSPRTHDVSNFGADCPLNILPKWLLHSGWRWKTGPH